METKIDLHGVKHELVKQTLDSFIWEHMKRKSESIQVITGNSSEMKKLVTELANEYGFVYVEGLINSAQMTINLL